jgi:hypothetical protein
MFYDRNGNLLVSIGDPSGLQVDVQNSVGDAHTSAKIALVQMAYNMGFNGSTMDRWRANNSVAALASAARTAEATADLTNYNARGMVIVVDVTVRAVATTLTPKLLLRTPVNGAYDFTIWQAAAAINTADGTFAYYFDPASAPGAAGLFSEEIDLAIPRATRLVVTPSDANSVTYSADVYYLL